MIELRNLTIGFPGKPVLRNIEAEIPRGGTTIVAGASGSGKSVLMKTICALIPPLSGRVYIDGEDVFSLDTDGLRTVRKRLSMLFQGAALFDSMTVYQNVSLPLYEHSDLSDSEIRALVREKLDLVGLTDVEGLMPSELSGGMKKRVGLARAIIRDPDYIIYDEPTTGLDPSIAQDITELILALEEQMNLTSLVITHDLQCIARTARNMIMVDRGELVYQGGYQEFLHFDHPAARQFQIPGGKP